jgi:starvation-inducible outer membrane lipoprotein
MIPTLLRAALPAATLLLAGCVTAPASPLEASALDQLSSHQMLRPLTLAECQAFGGAHLCKAAGRVSQERECMCVSRDALRDQRAVMSLVGAGAAY